MPQLGVSFVAGLLFSIGLVISGMVDPRKVIAFLDFTGEWDPTLLFVLGGALAVTIPTFRVVLRQARPTLAQTFSLPAKRNVDTALLAGSALFGIGWGLAGLCPGPALTLLGSGKAPAFGFVGAMTIGVLAHRALFEARPGSDAAARLHRDRNSPDTQE
jgi:uncharacterized membrane protein YedE/YeeE